MINPQTNPINVPMAGTLTDNGAGDIPRQIVMTTSGNPAAQPSNIPKPIRSSARSSR